ncbi:MAG: hypothetical protein RSD49_06595 [Hafnia sp.]
MEWLIAIVVIFALSCFFVPEAVANLFGGLVDASPNLLKKVFAVLFIGGMATGAAIYFGHDIYYRFYGVGTLKKAEVAATSKQLDQQYVSGLMLRFDTMADAMNGKVDGVDFSAPDAVAELKRHLPSNTRIFDDPSFAWTFQGRRTVAVREINQKPVSEGVCQGIIELASQTPKARFGCFQSDIAKERYIWRLL